MRIFSYLPNPRVLKALIAAEYSGATIEVIGDKPKALANWLWDFDARELNDDEKVADSPYAREGRRGFTSTLYKSDAFLKAHPFGTVPAAFSPDGEIGVFESNSILRAAARSGPDGEKLYPSDDPFLASRIDSFLDATLVFGREFQVYLLNLTEMSAELYQRMEAAYDFYMSGVEQALSQTRYLAGDKLTIADIGFVCDLAQFLKERHMTEKLDDFGFSAITSNIGDEYPLAFQHLKALAREPNFEKHIASLTKEIV